MSIFPGSAISHTTQCQYDYVIRYNRMDNKRHTPGIPNSEYRGYQMILSILAKIYRQQKDDSVIWNRNCSLVNVSFQVKSYTEITQ